MDADRFVQGLYGSKLCDGLKVDDVVFKVVSPRPEARKVYRFRGEVRITSHVVVRAFAPVVTQGLAPNQWALVRWDVRQWCNSNAVFEKFLRSFVHCDKVSEVPNVKVCKGLEARPRPRVQQIDEGPTRRLALPAPSMDGSDAECQVIVPYGFDHATDILSRLADALADGAGPHTDGWLDEADFKSTVDHAGVDDALERLCDIGAIDRRIDDEGFSLVKILPAGIQWTVDLQVDAMMNDIDSSTSYDAKELKDMSKLELLFNLLYGGAKVPWLGGRSRARYVFRRWAA